MSAAHTGKRQTAETRAKIAASNIGKHSSNLPSAKQRAAVSAAQRGKPKPLQQRERISQAHIARRPPDLPLREVHRREKWRLYKRALRARRRATAATAARQGKK